MNPVFPQEMNTMHHDAFSQVKKVPMNFGPLIDDLATTLFLGDLAVICDENKLYDLFRRFGIIESIQLKKSDRDPQRAHLGFGFIKFSSRDSAERALQEMNGYFFLGRSMRVGWALDFGKKTSQSLMEPVSDPKKNQTAQIHVMFVTRELNRRVSELDLGAVFRRYGNLVDIAIKKNAINHESGLQSGYAFLHFALTPEGLKSAVSAVEEGIAFVIDNITYRCKVTHTLQTQLISVNHKQEKKLGKRNLPPSLSHGFPTPLENSSFDTYKSLARIIPAKPLIHSVASNKDYPVSEYHERELYSYGIHSTKTMNHSEHSYEVLPPRPALPARLDDLYSFEANELTSSSPFSKSFQKISNDTSGKIYPSSTVNHDNTPTTIYTTISQHNLNDTYHLPTRPLTLSLLSLSSFSGSTYEDSLRRRRNNDNDNDYIHHHDHHDHHSHDITRY